MTSVTFMFNFIPLSPAKHVAKFQITVKKFNILPPFLDISPCRDSTIDYTHNKMKRVKPILYKASVYILT